MLFWEIVSKRDPRACALADRHYSRRKIGSGQFMPPGQTVVLLTSAADAVFGWWRPHPASGIQSMNKLDGWTCTIFRNEGPLLSSDLILDAELVFAEQGLDIGPDGLLTYVHPRKIRSTNPGFCFQKAGYVRAGFAVRDRKPLFQKRVA